MLMATRPPLEMKLIADDDDGNDPKMSEANMENVVTNKTYYLRHYLRQRIDAEGMNNLCNYY